VETLGAGPVVVEHRQRVVGAFRALIVAQNESGIVQVTPLMVESVVASVMGIIYARLLDEDEQKPLIELLGPLMGTVMTPFVANERMVAEEEQRGEELAEAIGKGDFPWSGPAQAPNRDAGSGVGVVLPATLTNPNARRLRECVMFLAAQSERELGPSNREVGTAIGVGHKSQISKLLSQLEDEGLAAKRSVGSGRPNEWRLTPRGEEMARALAVDWH
jgi:hypothetical protein